jgi:biotin carboxyl carrier protein
MIRKLRVTVDGKQYDVTVEVDDESGLAPAPAPVRSLSSVTAPVIAAPVSGSPPTAGSAAAGPGDVPSPLAGRVTAINVASGQEVKEGEHLLTLEAMKMNTFVMAPRAGKVAEIKVSVGSAVEERQTLLTIE